MSRKRTIDSAISPVILFSIPSHFPILYQWIYTSSTETLLNSDIKNDGFNNNRPIEHLICFCTPPPPQFHLFRRSWMASKCHYPSQQLLDSTIIPLHTIGVHLYGLEIITHFLGGPGNFGFDTDYSLSVICSLHPREPCWSTSLL